MEGRQMTQEGTLRELLRDCDKEENSEGRVGVCFKLTAREHRLAREAAYAGRVSLAGLMRTGLRLAAAAVMQTGGGR